MIEIDGYVKAWETFPVDRVYRAFLREGYRSRFSASLGHYVFRLSDDVKISGEVLKKGTWCIQQGFLIGVHKTPTVGVNFDFSELRKEYVIKKDNLVKNIDD